MGERWITWRGRHLLVNNDGNIITKYKTEHKKERDGWNKISLKDEKEELGYLEYTDKNENLTVGSIYVKEQHRRKGLGTQLLNELKPIANDRTIRFSAVLDDGEKLIKSKTNIIRKDYSDYYAKLK